MNKPAPKPRPVPRPTANTQFFWDAAKRGKLALQYDPDADRYQFWPRAISTATGRRNLEWRETSGRGEVYSTPSPTCRPPGSRSACPMSSG